MNPRSLKTFIIGFVICAATTANGQSTKKIISDAWVYIGTLDNYNGKENIELVKRWETQPVCVVSFEKGLYSTSDESGHVRDKGKWAIEQHDTKTFLIVTLDNGTRNRFEIVSADKTKLKLRRVT